MKESPRRYTNPFLSDEENENLNLWTQELQDSNIDDDDNLKHSLESEVYTDKNVLECEVPEMLICYKDGSFHVKDICVDEGMIPLHVLEPSNDHMNVTEKEELKEEVVDSVGSDELKEVSKDDMNVENRISKFAPDGFMVISESVTVSTPADDNGEEKSKSSDDLLDHVSTEQAVSKSGPALEHDRVLPSLQSLLESIDQPPCENLLEEISKTPEESENNTLNLNKTEPTTNIENLEPVNEPSIDPNSATKVQDTDTDNIAMVNRGELESSFSVAGHVPEHITYSGPIAFSGSTSLRSDSSTTSARSFAFPILQNEWNSSPVRMAKADRRRLQKHRGWKHGLLCCRF